MKRRNFFRIGLFGVGATVLTPLDLFSQESGLDKKSFRSKVKNIIFLVSDGMSSGTLNMADMQLFRATGKGSNWLNLYRENKVSRALMDMASASSIVTDSAAASSSWSCGYRVENGKLNMGRKEEPFTPILQKFKKAGKKVGCVTTVQITHATPAGFLINSNSRGSMESIAEMYLEQNFDVLLGGGHEVFSAAKRKDGKDMYSGFVQRGYEVVQNRTDLMKTKNNKPLLGVFHEGGLPYALDHKSSVELMNKVPTLAEMTAKAIENMKDHPAGFVMQVEGGKVDWAAHANDVGGVIFDQIAFDECVKVAIDFADQNKETLVILTTDHGNSNPGLLYGKDVNTNFDRIQNFKHTNEWILNEISPNDTADQVIKRIDYANAYKISIEEAEDILKYYRPLEKKEDALYNYKQLPFKLLSEIQKKYTNVGWIGDNHSADFVELAMYGPGSENLTAFVKNTDLHNFMLMTAGVDDLSK
jgi:alkaline phosphatase